MSASIRQSNLFSAEDYKKVFKSYQFIDYTAYDFDTLKQAMINYIQTYYPEDFNDYIESSEFIAIIELIAYLGTSLAFRTDLNSRENFIDTAERRESIIRLAQMVNYVPRRNVAASGLFKIAAVQTDQPLTDANGVDINDLSIFWNDPNNPDWFDQFVQVCNSAFSTINPFGRPTKSGSIGSIPTDLYQLNNLLRQAVTYQTSATINGQQYPIDICNPDFVTNETIFERDPDPLNPFNFVYRNDSLGVSSANTGFFLYFKQGTLQNIDTNFEFPVPNRVFPVDMQNINQDDVYVQETDQSGTVISKWVKVPALAGENIIYNSIQNSQRNIFDVISGANDSVKIRFADGNFGNVPTGLFRTWVRVSANQSIVIRPDNVQGLQISIPYIGSDQQQHTLRVVFNLEQTIGNAAPSETDEQIKLRAPEVFSTQSRMVNGSDYNVLPLIYGNQIAKIQAVNRTYSGQSRYIDLHDPTGFHKDLIIFGQDAALYRDNQDVLTEVVQNSSNTGYIETILINSIQETLRSPKVLAFFYDEYLTQFESTVRVNPTSAAPTGFSLLDLQNTSAYGTTLQWQTSPAKLKNDTGYFVSGNQPAMLSNSFSATDTATGEYKPWGFITESAIVEFTYNSAVQTASVSTVIQSGLPAIINASNPYANVGPVGVSNEIRNQSLATKVYPAFRNTLNTTEIARIVAAVRAGISFYLYYDILGQVQDAYGSGDSWGVSVQATPGIANQSQQPFKYAPTLTNTIYSDWISKPASGLVYIDIIGSIQQSTTTFGITARGRAYVFESYRDVRFYWEPNQVVIDNASGQALRDTIEIMPFVNTNNSVNNNSTVIGSTLPAPYLQAGINFNVTGVFTQDDGYLDTAKVAVSLADANNNGVPDDPRGFNKVVANTDRVVFEYYSNEVSGYQSTRPWLATWGNELASYTGNVYVHFPSGSTASPFISNNADQNYAGSDLLTVVMPITDLVLVNNETQLASIATQVSAQLAINSQFGVVTDNFVNKVYLISTSTPGYGIYKLLEVQYLASGTIVSAVDDKYHFDRNGKVFTQNTDTQVQKFPLYFKWSHYSPIDQRVDPAPTNIVDMIVVTDSYYRDIVIWKNNNGSLATMPAKPTTEELRIQFQGLNQYKMISDSMIWNSGDFRVLFGPQADEKLQATFKVVKSAASSVSDNEIKTKVIQAIDAYFDIRNWDFGEKFFYTELAAFIHQQLSKIISSVVIVPNNANSQFGNLFEIVAGPSQLFISTATVNNVSIVANLTSQNLRV